MPKYRITSPDGKTFEITAPDGATQEQVLAYAQTQMQQPQPAAAVDPTDGMSTADKLLAGAGKAFVDVGRGVGQLARGGLESVGGASTANTLGLPTRADIDAAKLRDAPLMATGAGLTGNILGSVASIAPVALLPGANTVVGGSVVGALSGAMQPVGEKDSRLANVAIGGGTGGAVPALIHAGKIGKAAFIDPFTNAGQEKIIGRALNAAAGNDAAAAMRNMQTAATPFTGPSPAGQAMRQTIGEIVPGSIPTAAQTAQNAGIAALQRTASQTDPIVMNEFANIAARQNAARVNSLQSIAGDDGMRAFFAADRDSVANQLYGDAFKNASGTPTPYMKGQITQLLKRPSIDDARKVAQRLAMERGERPSAAGSLRALHDVKTALGDKIAKALQEGADGEVRALMATKDKLVSTMEKMSPGYGEARTTYAAMSKPINQMDVAQAIADKSISPLTGSMQPNAFARALNDGTAVRATGFDRATLENTMDAGSLSALGAIKDDLASQVFAQNAGRGVGSDTVQKLAYSNLIGQSGLPSWVTSMAPSQIVGRMAGQGANLLYSNANKEMSTKLAEALMRPDTAATVMQKAGVPMSDLARYLMIGSQGASLSLPSIVNSIQQ